MSRTRRCHVISYGKTISHVRDKKMARFESCVFSARCNNYMSRTRICHVKSYGKTIAHVRDKKMARFESCAFSARYYNYVSRTRICYVKSYDISVTRRWHVFRYLLSLDLHLQFHDKNMACYAIWHENAHVRDK